MRLIKETVSLAFHQGADTWLFTVNPRHESVYRRLFTMKTVARRESTKGLTNAPAVFMRADVEDLPPEWKTFGDPILRRAA